jgi:hypothetical protein
MNQVLFLLYIFLLGFCFGLCFKKWIPFEFIVLSSFLVGSIIYSLIMSVLYMLRINIDSGSFLGILFSGLLTTLIFILKTWGKGFDKKELGIFLFVSVNFILLNIFFVEFNFSRASGDSFTYIHLARNIGFNGFNDSVIQTFLSWGGFIPIIQAASIYLGFDYLVSLQFSFWFSFILLFSFFCEKFCFESLQNRRQSITISSIATLIFISTPMILFQLVYIHSNLTTAFFLFLASICGWLALKENNNYWFVFFTLFLIGADLSRTESFIYSTVIISLLLFSNKFSARQRLFGLLPNLILQEIWFVYLFQRLMNTTGLSVPQTTNLFDNTKSLNPQKLLLLNILMLIIIGFIIISKDNFLSRKIFPLLQKYYILFFLFAILLLVILKPTHMITSIASVFDSLFLKEYWGLSFWLISLVLLVFVFSYKTPFEKYLINITISNTLIIIALAFLRKPYHPGWGDSANRLMTIGIPFGLFLLVITFCKWLKERPVLIDHD